MKVDTPLLVKNKENDKWRKRYFKSWESKNTVICFIEGLTSTETNRTCSWTIWEKLVAAITYDGASFTVWDETFTDKIGVFINYDHAKDCLKQYVNGDFLTVHANSMEEQPDWSQFNKVLNELKGTTRNLKSEIKSMKNDIHTVHVMGANRDNAIFQEVGELKKSIKDLNKKLRDDNCTVNPTPTSDDSWFKYDAKAKDEALEEAVYELFDTMVNLIGDLNLLEAKASSEIRSLKAKVKELELRNLKRSSKQGIIQ